MNPAGAITINVLSIDLDAVRSQSSEQLHTDIKELIAEAGICQLALSLGLQHFANGESISDCFEDDIVLTRILVAELENREEVSSEPES